VELLMITPYFIPGKGIRGLLRDLRLRGVRVRILTNSLASTPELLAHSGYVHYRLPMLEEGVELFEVKPLLGNSRGSGETLSMTRFGNYALHAKLFVFDRQRVFIGSMNLDQRSHKLNTEVGVIIDSPELARQVAVRFESIVAPENSYGLVLRPARQRDEPPQLVWRTSEAGRTIDYDEEPARSAWQRLKLRLLTLLPLDSEL
jgi:putative cardiolipin synthase